jgi:hypothetical protein
MESKMTTIEQDIATTVNRKYARSRPPWWKFAIVAAVTVVLGTILYQSIVGEQSKLAVNECVRFVDELKTKRKLFTHANRTEVGRTWMKNGSVVVQIREYEEANGIFRTRLCVVGNDTVQIVPGFEHWRWE